MFDIEFHPGPEVPAACVERHSIPDSAAIGEHTHNKTRVQIATPAPSDPHTHSNYDANRRFKFGCPHQHTPREKGEPLSNFKACESFGVSSFVGTIVRISDKYSRLTQLVRKMQEGKGPSVSEERITDTLMDLAVYCLIARILYEEGGLASARQEA